MDVEKVLAELTNYYSSRGMVGNTHTMAYGAANSNASVLVRNLSESRHIASLVGMENKEFLTMRDIEKGALRGLNKPIVMDNFFLMSLFLDLSAEMRSLKGFEEMKKNIQFLLDAVV